MGVYQFQGDLDFAGAGGRPLELDVCPGRPQAAGWGDPVCVPFDMAGFVLLDCVQMVSGGEFCLLSERSRSVLAPLFAGCGEFLPVRLQGRAYWWFNCLVFADCLSDAGRLLDWDAPGRFFEEAPGVMPFDAGRLAAAPAVFRVPQIAVGDVFVRQAVVAAIRDAGLAGFDLRPVWPVLGASVSVLERWDLGQQERMRLVAAKRSAAARAG